MNATALFAIKLVVLVVGAVALVCFVLVALLVVAAGVAKLIGFVRRLLRVGFTFR